MKSKKGKRMTQIEMIIRQLELDVESKELSLKTIFKHLAHDFGLERGPGWDSSGYENTWKELRVEIRTLKNTLDLIHAVPDKWEDEGEQGDGDDVLL